MKRAPGRRGHLIWVCLFVTLSFLLGYNAWIEWSDSHIFWRCAYSISLCLLGLLFAWRHLVAALKLENVHGA